MIFIFLISLHLFLMLAYSVAIEVGISRHQHSYLLFALFLPLVGELCLFISEFVKADMSFNADGLFKKNKSIAVDCANSDMMIEQPITREQLFNVIDSKPSNIVQILRASLTSTDPEIVHVSAATIMKMQRNYENQISEANATYISFPDNMDNLKKYISILGEYYASELLTGDTSEELILKQEELLLALLSKMPLDEMGISTLIDNYIGQNKLKKAEDICTYYSQRINDYFIWEKSFIVATLSSDTEKQTKIREIVSVISLQWKPAQKELWRKLTEVGHEAI